MRTFKISPTGRLNYDVNLTKQLSTGDLISSVSSVVLPLGPNVTSEIVSGSKRGRIWFDSTGSVIGTSYVATITLTTIGGARFVRSIRVIVERT